MVTPNLFSVDCTFKISLKNKFENTKECYSNDIHGIL